MTEAILHAAFIPFGNIVSVQLAVDPGSRKYCFIHIPITATRWTTL